MLWYGITFYITGLFVKGILTLVTGGFPTQRASNLELLMTTLLTTWTSFWTDNGVDWIETHRHSSNLTQIAKFMGPTWGPTGSCRPQMGPMLAPWTLLSGYSNSLTAMVPLCCVLCWFSPTSIWASILMVSYHKIFWSVKARDLGLDFSNCPEIWQAPQQQHCQNASHRSKMPNAEVTKFAGAIYTLLW